MTTLFRPAGSWVALVTPMRDDGAIDQDALSRLLSKHVAAGTDGIVLAGTTGESAALEPQEYAALLEAALEALDGRLPVLAGVGSPSTAHAVALARIAGDAGVDGLLAVTPYYLRTTQAGLEAHYHALTEAVPLPIVLYNVPARTGVDLLPATTAALSRLETIVGIKEASPDPNRVPTLVAQCDPGFSILSGDDATSAAALRAGASGIVSVTANVLPGLVAELCAAAAQGADDRVTEIERRMAYINAALMREPNPIPVKGLLARRGLIGARLRLPLVPASTSLVDELDELINKSFQAECL